MWRTLPQRLQPRFTTIGPAADCREAGFSGHFVKSVDLEAVSEAVRRLVAGR